MFQQRRPRSPSDVAADGTNSLGVRAASRTESTEDMQALIKLKLLNNAYLEFLSESELGKPGGQPLSLSETNLLYEMQFANLAFEKSNLFDISIWGNSSIYLISGTADEHSLSMHAVELYSRYLSRQLKRDRPIFAYSDYDNAEIRFRAFLVLSEGGSLESVIFYDDYETSSSETFELRFIWCHPFVRFCDDKKKYAEKSSSISTFMRSQPFELTGNPYFREFNRNPIQASFASRLSFNDQETLLATLDMFTNNKKSPRVNAAADKCRQSITAINERMQNTELQALQEAELPRYRAEHNESYYSTLPQWAINEHPAFQIQVPLLNREEWQNFEVINDAEGNSILGANYICLLANRDIPQVAKNMAIRYSYYLKKEQNYDFSPYTGFGGSSYDIFFIMRADYSCCVGVLIFENGHQFGEFFKIQQDNYKLALAKKNIPENQAIDFLAKKTKRVEEKFDAAIKNCGDDIGKRPADPNYKKYAKRINELEGINFFAKAKTHLPPDADNTRMLTVAWIHPFCRREGILAKLWPALINRYGAFKINSPSEAMRAFLDKQNAIKCVLVGSNVLVA